MFVLFLFCSRGSNIDKLSYLLYGFILYIEAFFNFLSLVFMLTYIVEYLTPFSCQKIYIVYERKCRLVREM